ncbi:MAG: hypothetical protein MI919_40485, partial [Holophagales bacterium]|nr:hypothetical protein [Holophagales bacterium]
MKPLKPTDFPYEPSLADALLAALTEAFPDHELVEIRREVVVHDTFDWRLYKDGGTLTLTTESFKAGAVYQPAGSPELVWCNLEGGERFAALLDEPEVPAFAEDFADPEV